jgi:restriction endonuclease S subunit
MKCFAVYAAELGDRLDAGYYSSKDDIAGMIRKSAFKFVELGDLGIEMRKGIFNLEPIEYQDKGVPFIRISNIVDAGIDFDSMVYITVETNRREKRTQLKPGDLVFAKIGTVDRIGMLPSDYPCYNMSQNIIGLKLAASVDKQFTPDFLRFFFQLRFAKAQLLKLATSQVQLKLTLASLRRVKIPAIPLETQNQAVETLQSAYERRKQKHEEAKKLSESINGFVLERLGISLPEFEDSHCHAISSQKLEHNRADAEYYQPKYEKLEKALAKGKYQVRELSKLSATIVSGQRPKGGVAHISDGIPSLGGEHILADGSIAINNLKFVSRQFHNLHLKSRIQRGDILLVKDGATTGKVGIIPNDYPYEEANINEHVFLIRFEEDINSYYIFMFLTSLAGQTQLKREVTGGTIMGIVRDAASNIKIPMPPRNVQDEIGEEAKKRMHKTRRLQDEAKEEVEKAKAEVEKMILAIG